MVLRQVRHATGLTSKNYSSNAAGGRSPIVTRPASGMWTRTRERNSSVSAVSSPAPVYPTARRAGSRREWLARVEGVGDLGNDDGNRVAVNSRPSAVGSRQ